MRRAWYVLAAAVGVGGFLVAMAFVMPNWGGGLGQRFATGQVVTVQLSEDHLKMVWAKDRDGAVIDLDCGLDAESVKPISITMVAMLPPIGRTFRGERWQGLRTVAADPAGRYRIVCEATPTSLSLAIGNAPHLNEPSDRVLGGLVAVVMVSTGGILAVVGWLRRRAHTDPSRSAI